MLKINTNEKKRLKFNISVSGVEPKDLKGSMKIMIEGVEYGFPILIENGDVVVNIQPFSTISGRDFKDGEKFDAQLDIIAGDTYLKPWSDKVVIENPLKIEATLSGIEDIKETTMPSINISAIEEDEVEEECGDDHTPEKKKKKKKSRFGKMLGGE